MNYKVLCSKPLCHANDVSVRLAAWALSPNSVRLGVIDAKWLERFGTLSFQVLLYDSLNLRNEWSATFSQGRVSIKLICRRWHQQTGVQSRRPRKYLCLRLYNWLLDRTTSEASKAPHSTLQSTFRSSFHFQQSELCSGRKGSPYTRDTALRLHRVSSLRGHPELLQHKDSDYITAKDLIRRKLSKWSRPRGLKSLEISTSNKDFGIDSFI